VFCFNTGETENWSNRENGTFVMASRMNPFIFLQQVRQETAKVTWPSRRETTISVMMVLVFAIIASVFFLAADQLIAFLVATILNIGA
jgi:preprotein translocase subunit SecE